MRNKNPVKNLNQLKKMISKLGPALPGTIRKVKLRCGRRGCRCQSGRDKDKHGPYYFWSYKVKGKLTTSSVPKKSIKQFQLWIENRRQLERLVDQLLSQGRENAMKALQK